MKTTILMASLAVACVAVPTIAFADKGDRGARMLERIDTDKSGSISQTEFLEARTSRFDSADANNDGELTADEVAAQMERRRNERRAKRMLERMDIDGDGKVTRAEIESQATKRFALMDRDDSGAIEKDEMRRMGKRGKGDRKDRKRRRD
ncbi:MAG: EF-hand domain-containing protein [Pseudomonadota bacterium]